MIPLTVLWDQPPSTNSTNAWVSQQFTDLGSSIYDTYEADDFVNPVPWTVQKIYIPGDAVKSLSNASTLNFEIYADSSGAPDGDPSGGGNAPQWSLSVAPSDSQIALSNGTSGYQTNVTLTLTTPFTLLAGHYWLVFYPEMAFAGGAYGRQPSDTTNQGVAESINPGAGWTGYSSWTSDQTVFNPYFTQHDFAFRLEGSSSADVSIFKTGQLSSDHSTITWTLAVSNAGPSAALNVVATDSLVNTTKFASVQTSSGNCSGSATLVCSLGTLAPGGKVTITLKAKILTSFIQFTNTGKVSSTTHDPFPGNNTSTASVP